MDSFLVLLSSLAGLDVEDVNVDFGSLDQDIQYRGEDGPQHGDGADIMDLHDEMFDIFNELDEKLFAAGGVTEAIGEVLRERRAALQARNDAIQEHLQTAKGVKLVDKLTFVFGVANVALTGFIAGAFPQHMPMWYSIKFFTLVGVRLVQYKRQNYHYFLFDFCYFANLLLMLSIWVFPENRTLFNLCFSFSMGPLSWAVLAWRNSMVFHSMEKITSVFIHLGPPAVVHNLRWWAANAGDRSMYKMCHEPGSCQITFYEATIWPLLPYLFWQIAYWIKVEYWEAEKVKSKNYLTSFRYLIGETQDKETLIYRFCSQFGERWQQPMFMLVQLIFTFCTMLPVKLFYDYDFIHTGFYFFVFLVSVWNGANFYVEVFAKKYASNLPAPADLSVTTGRRSRASSRVIPVRGRAGSRAQEASLKKDN